MTRDAVISRSGSTRWSAAVEMGYDTTEVRRVPQRWPDPGHPVTDAEGNLARFTRAQ